MDKKLKQKIDVYEVKKIGNLGAPVLLNFGALSKFSKGSMCFSCLFGNQGLIKSYLLQKLKLL